MASRTGTPSYLRRITKIYCCPASAGRVRFRAAFRVTTDGFETMTLPVLLFLTAAAAMVVIRTTMSYISTARNARADWKDIVARLQPLHMQGLQMVARDFLEPAPGQLRLDPDEIWGLVGGSEGLKRMRANADVMLALAAYTQRWNFEEGVIVAERMRRDARKIHRAIWHLQLQSQ